MNDLILNVAGWVATEPKLRVGASGTSVASFRLASTSRYFDRGTSAWKDGQTEWFTVRVFRAAAITVSQSIAKGQPVLVQGRLRSNDWESESGPRTELLLDATAVGHDLTRGIARFVRANGDEALDPSQHGAEALEDPIAGSPEGAALAESGEDDPGSAPDEREPAELVVAAAS
jgi:single-strand DNA-binding protein